MAASDVKRRRLFIDFDLYTDGDPEFRQELITLMTDNIRELRQSLEISIAQKDPEIYRAACHKIKVTLDMLNDPELNATVEAMKELPRDDTDSSKFYTLCDSVIQSLQGSGS